MFSFRGGEMDFDLLKRLSETPGVCGWEEEVRLIMADLFAEVGAEVRTDALGNLIGHLPGGGRRVAIMAHMDEVGFLVSKIEPEGLLRMMPVGGVDQRVVYAQKLIVHGRQTLPGVVGTIPPHLLGTDKSAQEKAIPLEECFLDLGLTLEEAVELVRVGDPITYATRAWETQTSFFGKALDDRVGLLVMIEACRRAKKIDCDLYLVATVQEEYGLRGAGPAAFCIEPEVVVILEGTFATDTPGIKPPTNVVPTVLGKGPEIRLTDKLFVADRGLTDFLARLACQADIPHQIIVKKGGTTDAAAGQVAGAGSRAAAVSVPARYIHGPVSVIAKADAEAAVGLMSEFLERVSQLD